MQMHVNQPNEEGKGALTNRLAARLREHDRKHRDTQRLKLPRAGQSALFLADFLDIAGLREPNRLLYRCIPLTCARSQE
jgi:hypothetical protein